MPVVCGLVIFELAAVIAVGILILLESRRSHADIGGKWMRLFAEIDKSHRNLQALKADIDGKFGKDLIEKLNAIYKIGQHPNDLTVGKDGQFHKINREY